MLHSPGTVPAKSQAEGEGEVIDKSQTGVLPRMAASPSSTLPLPRLLLVFAHPDDEVLALGGRLERMRHSRLLTLTDGAPADGADARQHGFASLAQYRTARRAELLNALAHAGLPSEVAPGFPHAVPDQTAAHHLAPLARAIAAEITAFQPDAVLTHPYEGGHPDHDACAFATHAAVRLAVSATPGTGAVSIVEMPFYHAGKHGSMATGVFLPAPENVSLIVRELTPIEQRNKAARLACFPSQTETLAQFGVDRESFRLAPAYDFLHSPHEGQLFYERFPWGMTGDGFCKLASEALRDLFERQPESVPGIFPRSTPTNAAA